MDLEPSTQPDLIPHRPRLLWYLLYSLVPCSLLIYSVVVLWPRPASIQINEVAQAPISPIIVPGSLQDTGIKAEAFTDVDRSTWSWKYIQQISPIGIIPPKSPTQFDPQGLVSRLDMAKFLLKTYELITKNSPPVVPTTFTDLADLTSADQDTIAKIFGLKITAGTTATTFSPSDPVNRAQMVTFISSLYKSITGEFPPEVDVPFTDIYDPDLEWSVKYIKKTYNLKITAGTTATTFSPRDNVTREQMATFIFSFMRLFGPSYNNPSMATELSGVKSVVLNQNFWDKEYLENGYTNFLNSTISEITKTGFNTVWFVYPWSSFNPKPFSTPPIYNEVQFTNLLNTLELLKKNQMKAIIGLNYLGDDVSNPDGEGQGVDQCTWTTDLRTYLAFETYVGEFLRRIENYSDMTYILFFSEGAEPCSLNAWDPAQAPQIASILRPTLGSLPQRLDPTLRNKFKIGFHDWTLLSRKMALGESPIQMPLSYDFYSFNMYEGEGKTVEQIGNEFDTKITNIKAMYPFTPIFVGEFGAASCNVKTVYYSYDSSATEQSRVLDLSLKKVQNLNLGFNIWDWKGQHFESNQTCPENQKGQWGIVYNDQYLDFSVFISKPARVEIQKLLNPTAPAPQCIEQSSPTFAQKIIDQNHKLCQSFTSSCIPPGWSVVPGITDCKQACTGEPVWLFEPVPNDIPVGPGEHGRCAINNPYPSDCFPVSKTGYPSGYEIDYNETCRLTSSSSPTPTPTPTSSIVSSPTPSPLPQPTLLPKTSALPSPTTASQTQADTPESPQLTTASPTSLLDRAIDAIQAVKAFLTRLTFPSP